MNPDNVIQTYFFICLAVFITATTLQVFMHWKKKHIEDITRWQRYHRWQFIYQMISMPSGVATGVLLSKVQFIGVLF